jgi:hypothetical protein
MHETTNQIQSPTLSSIVPRGEQQTPVQLQTSVANGPFLLYWNDGLQVACQQRLIHQVAEVLERAVLRGFTCLSPSMGSLMRPFPLAGTPPSAGAPNSWPRFSLVLCTGY